MLDLKVIYVDNEYYIFEPIKNNYYKFSNYNEIIYEPTIKLTINETTEKLYKISISSYDDYYIFTKNIINIKTIVSQILKKYNYEIINMDASCLISKEGELRDTDTINEIYLDVYKDKKPIKQVIQEFINKVLKLTKIKS
jgi:hypothetical protein